MNEDISTPVEEEVPAVEPTEAEAVEEEVTPEETPAEAAE